MTTPTAGVLDRARFPGLFLLVVCAAAALGVAILAWERLAVLGLLGLIAFGLFLREPAAGLFVTTGLLLLFSGQAGLIGFIGPAVPVTAAKLCGAATFAAWAINLVARRRPFHVTWPVVFLLAFLGWSLLGLVFSPTFRAQLPEWSRLATVAAFFVMAVHLLDTPRKVRAYVVLILACGVVMAGFAVAQYFLPSQHLEAETAVAAIGAGADGAFIDADSLQGGPAIRVSGRAGHSNWLALALLLILPLNAYWFTVVRSPRAKALILAAVLVELAALVFTFTRTGLLVGTALALVLLGKRLLRVNAYHVAALMAALLVAWFLLPPAYKERVLTPAQYVGSESVRHRLELQDAAWEQMQQHPVFGIGIGGFGLRLMEGDRTVSYILNYLVEDLGWNPVFYGAHNLYLQVGCETGAVGLVLLLLFLAAVVRANHRAAARFRDQGDRRMATLASAVEVSLISFLLCAVFLHALHQKIWWMIAAVAVANALLARQPAAEPVLAEDRPCAADRP